MRPRPPLAMLRPWLAALPALGLLLLLLAPRPATGKVCIVGSGIGGSSAAFFTSVYSTQRHDIHVFEATNRVGGRASRVRLSGKEFEAGASIIHERNLHMKSFAKTLGLKPRKPPSSTLGIWNGKRFVYLDQKFGDTPLLDALSGFYNFFSLNYRYNPLHLLQMSKLTQKSLNKWLKLYESTEKSFSTSKEMLQSVELWDETQKRLDEILLDNNLSPKLIHELVAGITRIQYGQDSSMSGLAGLVALIGTGGSLWAVEGGNWQIPDGLIRISNASLHLSTPVKAIRRASTLHDATPSDTAPDPDSHSDVRMDGYELHTAGDDAVHKCDAVVIATPLEESHGLQIFPPVSIPSRPFHHTHVTFVRGLLNENYFGLNASKVPELIATVEDDGIPFNCISKLHEYGKDDYAYKLFSREPLPLHLLDALFRWRNDSVSIDWAAYPKFKAPEEFAPFLLDSHHLYYVNAFENAASAMEASAVSARNIALLMLQRMEPSIPSGANDGNDAEEIALSKEPLDGGKTEL